MSPSALYLADRPRRLDQIKKKNKAAPVKPFQVKNHMWIFVNALIENPAFDSQTKEALTLKSSAFGSKCDLSEEFVKKGQITASHLDIKADGWF